MIDNYRFDIPSHHKSIIKVVGVGGGGSNAVTHMFNQGIKDVEFIVVNTDNQAIQSSTVPNKLQIGMNLTEGLGAGANPEIGKNAAIENKEDIRELLSLDTKMVFITAGMGGGTGTGAAPVIAQVARDLDILTVGIVTAPFSFEGRRKMQAAEKGINELKAACDTVLVISNDKLRDIHGNLSIRQAFGEADNVLATAARSIAEIITVTSEMNVDFQDVRTVMKNSGPAVMGSAEVEGENRAKRAAEQALCSPLLNNTEIKGAQKVLLSISYGEHTELTMDELADITDYIEEQAGYDAEVIWGQGIDPELNEAVRVTVIATGFDQSSSEDTDTRKVYDLESNKQIETQSNEVSNSAPATATPNPAPTPKPSSAEDKVVYDLESSDYEITEVNTNSTNNLEENTPPENSIENRLEAKRKRLIQESQERIRHLKDLEPGDELTEFKDQYDVPSYIRRKIDLQQVPHSSEQNISRYNLNDDNDILGDNKFLHDNVD